MDAGRLTVCVFHPDWTMAALLLYLFTVSDKGGIWVSAIETKR